MEMEDVILSKVDQKKSKFCVLTYLWYIEQQDTEWKVSNVSKHLIMDYKNKIAKEWDGQCEVGKVEMDWW